MKLETIDQIKGVLAGDCLLEHRYINLELKESWDQSHGQKLAALGNKISIDVAWMVLGVSDKTGLLVGKDEKWAKSTEEIISQHINRNLDPSITCKCISAFEIDGKWAIVIEVSPPGALVKWDDYAYKAAGTTIQKMSTEEAMEFTIKLPGLIDYSRQEYTGEINIQCVKTFFRLAQEARPQDENLRAIATRDPVEALQVLGIHKTNTSKILFGECKFRIVYFNESGFPVSNVSYPGLITLLDPSFRETTFHAARGAYSDRALKEAIANAVAHAAYFDNNGEVVVEIHPTFVAVTNLCAHESTIFANRWFSRGHKTLNPLLMETLRLCGAVDEMGIGKQVIFSESLLGGKDPPIVTIEPSGRVSRWRLTIPGMNNDNRRARLIQRLNDIYPKPQEALVAQALILWSSEPLAKIKGYMDGEAQRVLNAVLSHDKSPVWWHTSREHLGVKRWVRILLSEGKDSKSLTDEEKIFTYNTAKSISVKYRDRLMTAAQFRDFAGMGDTQPEKTLANQVLKDWKKRGLIETASKGCYRFLDINLPDVDRAESVRLLINKLIGPG